MKTNTDNDCFALQDTRSCVGDSALWWAKKGGYTSDIAQAEIMTREAAQRQHNCRETDLPWPLAALEGKGRQGVDMQRIGDPVELASYDSDTPCYLQVKSDYNGNDIIWIYADNGRRGADISQAKVMSASQALRELEWQRHLIAWPVAMIDALIQHRVPLSVLTDKAWEGCGIRRHVALQRARPIKYQCNGCGRFMTEAAFYIDVCRHCGTDNRP